MSQDNLAAYPSPPPPLIYVYMFIKYHLNGIFLCMQPELCKYGFNTVDETYSLLSRLLLSHTHNQLSHLVARSLASVAGVCVCMCVGV